MSTASAEELFELSTVRELCASGRAREVREAARLSGREVAAACGVTPVCISRWETGMRRPYGDAALRYGRLLAVLMQRR